MLCAENRVSLLNPPEEAVPDQHLKVLYSCEQPAWVHLHCIVSFDSGSVLTIELRNWSCEPGHPRIRSLTLVLPDWLVYRPDGTVRFSQWVLVCLLTVTLLSSIFASTGEHFGITKTLQPFNNELLEHLRLCAFSLWLLVTEPCNQPSLCGVLHRIDRQGSYVTPALFLTPSQLHVQVSGEAQLSSAFLCSFRVPMREWCHITVELHGTMFSHNLVMDDTEGYFVIGGGKFIRSVVGFFGPVVFYRNRIPEHRVSVKAVGRALFRLSLQKLGVSLSPSSVRTVLPWLQQAGCLHEPTALHLSAALYSAGSWLLSLLSAQGDHRLSLLRLGFLHLHGLSGLPTDPDLAYAYYANIGQQTVTDRLCPSAQQATVEVVHLTDEETLEQQTSEDHHIFQWLKFLAQKGEAQAEQMMGQMLFWGQQGVASDLHKAARHYQRGAELHEDPVSMYDYGIVLLQGQGVEKDIPKALVYLKKAMDRGSVPALSALGWYYERYEKNYVKAVELWERADLLESPDAAMNLGAMYLQYFLKSANRGHIKAANQVAEIWTTGLPGYVDRKPLDALSKWAAEHNGYLGSVLRRGLDLLFYLMAAESGFADAQFNVAYLCEQNTGQFLHPAFTSSCMWKYYNLTIHQNSTCRDSDDADSFLPCSLTLLGVYLQELHEDYSASIK
uniref:Uncharacterized protein n=1 Tax=Periophthalmus magnuspinnatus TaxID=409849 RepID=A0A3B4A7M1_9GOBI